MPRIAIATNRRRDFDCARKTTDSGSVPAKIIRPGINWLFNDR
jgi:hypothetical protein